MPLRSIIICKLFLKVSDISEVLLLKGNILEFNKEKQKWRPKFEMLLWQ